MAYGSYKVRITNPALFLMKLAGNMAGVMREEALADYFRSEFTQHIKASVGDYIRDSNSEILGIAAVQSDVARRCAEAIGPIFTGYGLELVGFSIVNLEVPEDDPNREKLEAAYAVKTESAIYGEEYDKFVERDILTQLVKQGEGPASAGAACAPVSDASLPFAQASENARYDAASPFELMRQLKGMRDIDAITQEEYEEKKRELLSRI